MRNVSRIISNFYCNGFFGRDYSLGRSVIVAEGDEWLVIRKPNGEILFASFQYEDNEVFKTTDDRQEYIDEWCNDER